MNTKKDILQVESLTKTYGKGTNQTEALKGISFRVLEGEFLGIMGASGSGKTTLLNCIATMLKPTSGKIILRGQDISGFHGGKLADYRGKKIGYLFQEFELLDKLAQVNRTQNKTIMMVTHDANAASYCSRILFIQDGQLFHELRRNMQDESTADFYGRIVTVMAQLGGGSANVL